jgi:hypothetical protein
VPPFHAIWFTLARESEAANLPAMQAIAKARDNPVQSPGPLPPGMLNSVALTHLNDMRSLANVLADSALLNQEQGNAQTAIERLLDLNRVARFGDGSPFIVSHLVGVGIEAMAAHRTLTVAARLKTDDVDPLLLHRHIRELLATERAAGRLQRGLATEAISMREIALARNASKWLIWPALLRVDRQNMLHITESASWPSPTRSVLGLRLISPRAMARNTMVSLSYLGRTSETTTRGVVERQAAAISLAARWYFNDVGHYPARLEDLVPKYLPAVPINPRNERPIFYSADVNTITFSEEAALARFDSSDPPRLPGPRPMVFLGVDPTEIAPPVQTSLGWHQIKPASQQTKQWRDLTLNEPPPPPFEFPDPAVASQVNDLPAGPWDEIYRDAP